MAEREPEIAPPLPRGFWQDPPIETLSRQAATRGDLDPLADRKREDAARHRKRA